MAASINTRKYAIYGGSFDPIHVGHVALADCAVKECGLDKDSELLKFYLSSIKSHNIFRACHNAPPLIFNCEIMKISQGDIIHFCSFLISEHKHKYIFPYSEIHVKIIGSFSK